MKFYLAPMEGITGFVYRNAHHHCFDGVDKYFTPFITPNQTRKLTSRELNDVLPEHNQNIMVVPQILTNKAEYFIWAARKLKELGYGEVNLNLGCPSGTVVSKGRGAGFLDRQVELNRFLGNVSDAMTGTGMKFSVKTRIGMSDPDEFEELLPMFNRYPLSELIIHPRLRTDFYKNQPNLEVFRDGLEGSRNPVCYNGDLFSKRHYQVFAERFPTVEMVMFGRGAIAHPGLMGEIAAGKKPDKQQLKTFHDCLLEGYRKVIHEDRNVLFKMKELWHYMGGLFEDGGKYLKKIKKADRMDDYVAAVSALFAEKSLVEKPGFSGWEKG